MMRIFYALAYRLAIVVALTLYSKFSIGQSVPVPNALDANNISRSSFIANWENVPGVFLYAIDVSDRLDFTSSVGGIVEGVTYESLNNIYVLQFSEAEISNLDLGVYYYRVRSVSLNGVSDNSAIKRVSLFKEAIGFSDRKIISDEYAIPYGLDVGDIDGDEKKDVVSLSYNLLDAEANNFVWHKQLEEMM